MTVYIDIVLIENLLMDYIILYTTAQITKNKIKHVKLILSSIVGSAYAVILFISNLDVYANIMLKILLSVSMIYIAFVPKNLKSMIKQVLIFYVVSFAIGGLAFSLIYFVKPQNIFKSNGFMVGFEPFKIVVLAGIVGFIIVTSAFKIIREKYSKSNMFCDIEIFYKEKSVKAKALIDSGNSLKDPISRLPVVVVQTNIIKQIIPYYLVENTDKILMGELEQICSEKELEEYKTKFRIIPFTSLGKENGLLLAFKPDKIKISWDENIIENVKVLIGLHNKKLTKTEEYTSIVGLSIFQEKY